MHEINLLVTEAQKALGIIEELGLPAIYILSTEEMQDGVLASYNGTRNVLSLDAVLGVRERRDAVQSSFGDNSDLLSTLVHEYIHWQDAENYRKKHGGKLDRLRAKFKKPVVELILSGYNISGLGSYAVDSLADGKFDEVYTEYRTYETLKNRR